MPSRKKCLDCGADTPVIGRRIGFFGLQETYSKYCRECIGNHAWEVRATPEEIVAEFDEAVRLCEESRKAHEARSRARAHAA